MTNQDAAKSELYSTKKIIRGSLLPPQDDQPKPKPTVGDSKSEYYCHRGKMNPLFVVPTVPKKNS